LADFFEKDVEFSTFSNEKSIFNVINKANYKEKVYISPYFYLI